MNVIFGGILGKSSGNVKVAENNPPSNGVPYGPWKHNRHRNRSSSIKPTDKPRSYCYFSSTTIFMFIYIRIVSLDVTLLLFYGCAFFLSIL